MNTVQPQILLSSLIKNQKTFHTETVYEITTQQTGLPFGIAIADIAMSDPHCHRQTVQASITIPCTPCIGHERRVIDPRAS